MQHNKGPAWRTSDGCFEIFSLFLLFVHCHFAKKRDLWEVQTNYITHFQDVCGCNRQSTLENPPKTTIKRPTLTSFGFFQHTVNYTCVFYSILICYTTERRLHADCSSQHRGIQDLIVPSLSSNFDKYTNANFKYCMWKEEGAFLKYWYEAKVNSLSDEKLGVKLSFCWDCFFFFNNLFIDKCAFAIL